LDCFKIVLEYDFFCSLFGSSVCDKVADQSAISKTLNAFSEENVAQLREAVETSGLCDVRFGAEAVGLTAEAERVRLTVRQTGGERTLDARFAVGCDGADVRLRDGRDLLPWPRLRTGRGGLTAGLRIRPGLWRIIRLERGPAAPDEAVSEGEVGRRVAEVLGPGPADVVWASRFRIHRRASPRFRAGRVVLAGDAAHVHSPVGGLGMNGGIQDAHNLAWKLAHAVRGGATEALLDSYDVERRAVIVEDVSRYTDLLTRLFLQAPARGRQAAFAVVRALFRVRHLQRPGLRGSAMFGHDYPDSPLLDGGERCAGVRLPNPLLRARDGRGVRLYDLLLTGPVIIDVAGDRGARDDLPLEHVIRVGVGAYRDPAGLLRALLGGADGWILVRPDAHIAWARVRRAGMEDGVRHALGTRR
jgi:hypothetical protein